MRGGVAMVFFFFLFGDWVGSSGFVLNGDGSSLPTILQPNGAGEPPAVQLRAGRSRYVSSA